MNVQRTRHRQRGVSRWTLTGSLLIVTGLSGLGFALIGSGGPATPVAPVATERGAATPATAGIKPAAPSVAPTVAGKTGPSSSGPHPNWHGTWQGTTPDSKMVISAAGVEVFDVLESEGKKDKFHAKLPWVNADEASGNSEESGYAKSAKSLAEISRSYESAVASFQREPSDLSISDPALSRRLIGRIKPGSYRVVWAYWGGDCGLRDMILDGDLILSIVNCRYQHRISLFTRQGATAPAVGQESQGTARVTAAPSLPNGRWQGAVTQAGYSPYPAVMHLQLNSAGVPGGTMAYPSMACTASLNFIRIESKTFWFRESIQEGRGKCVDGGQISVSTIPGDTLDWRYFMSGNLGSPVATATFRR